MRILILSISIAALAACSRNAGSNVAADSNADNMAASRVGPATVGDSAPADPAVGDALVPGTEYNATTEIPCGADGKMGSSCKAGVKRKWDDAGGALVEVTKPDGRKRALFFDSSGKATGADSAQADGSAGWDFKATREDDWTVISFGPERYKVPDALVLGG